MCAGSRRMPGPCRSQRVRCYGHHPALEVLVSAPATRRHLVRWLPAICWMLAIFGFSSLPGSDIPGSVVWLSPVAHFLEYALLASLLLFAVGRRDVTVRLALAVVIAASLYGVTDEVHQHVTPGRTPDPVDWATDPAGAGLAVLGIVLVRRRVA
jgi:hypothetical protein